MSECNLHSWRSSNPDKICPHCNAQQQTMTTELPPLAAEIDRLRAINTELREALDALLYACDGLHGGIGSDGAMNSWTNAKSDARAAIAHATSI